MTQSSVDEPAFRALVARLAAVPGLIGDLASGLSTSDLGWRLADGTFSFVEQACHLRDLEVEGYGVRIRRLLDEERPQLAGFDGTKVAAERDYQSQNFEAALAAFREAREANVRAVEALDETTLARGGVFEETGEITLGRLLESMVEHDEDHLAQMRAIRASRRVRPT